ncbi:hypothetical protein [Salipaludibacillus sp. CF4.18]|uniref:hypothetical protein n=1 Tax=Salipaludibacillus sp. CF4.18 TaxID=3373081 RepID=UPI003EE804E1
MSRQIVVKHLSVNHNLSVNKFPHQCGLCHKNIDPIFISSVFVRGGSKTNFMESSFQCTNLDCHSLIIGYYTRNSPAEMFSLEKTAPNKPIANEFSEEIKEVSPYFVNIYNQSFEAEQNELTLISGIGYRKALEFLIKDYLTYLNSDEDEKYTRMPLGQCLNQLDNTNIKEMAKRASWIGNDEAHYTRKWEDKDVTDLKRLIEVTVYYISMEVSSNKYLEEMK